MRRGSDKDFVKQALIDRLEDVCRWLLPNGRRRGRTWHCANPKKDADGQTPEMHIYFSGAVGSWKDYRSGDKGDVIKLVEYIHDTDFRGAMRLARDFLGLGNISEQEREEFREKARARQEVSNREAKRKEARKRARCERRWLTGSMLGEGTAAEHHARRYWLETRGIDVDAIQNLDRTTFRFWPSVEYWRLAEYKRDVVTGRLIKTKDGPQFPAILCAMRNVMGQFVDHHVTFLDPGKPDKADLGQKLSPRLMGVPNAGSVIRISHGPEGVPPEHAQQAHPVILAEGLETALSLAIAVPECRVWACASISGIRYAPVNYPFVSAVFVAGENDWEKPQAQRQLDEAMQALEQSGKPLELMFSHVGSDFNDLMKGE